MSFRIVNILDMLRFYGEDGTNNLLHDYECPQNPEIEGFIKQNAIEFAKRKMSITHLVLDDKGLLAAYFTLTHKPSTVGANILSNTEYKKLSRHARYDNQINAFNVSAFLIAQFGKNYNSKIKVPIGGNELMDKAISTLTVAQNVIGGGVVFLECENKPELLNFYQNNHNRFKIYSERQSDSEGIIYKQLLRFF